MKRSTLFLLVTFLTTGCLAQVPFELPCQAGSSPIFPSTYNPTTQMQRAVICSDPNGFVSSPVFATVGTGVTSVFTRTGDVVATNGDYTVAQVTGAAPLASPSLTGVPTAPTAAAATNTTQLATTAFVESEIPLRAPVTSFIGRTGAVVAATNDYSFSQLSGAWSTTQVPTGGSATAFLNGAGTYTAPTGVVTSVFTRTGAVVATSGDYTVGQVTGAAPLASPVFTTAVTLPATTNLPAAGTTLTPASGSSVTLKTPDSDGFIISAPSAIAGNATLSMSAGAASFTLPNGSNGLFTVNAALGMQIVAPGITTYNGNATVKGGVPSILATLFRTAQTAAVGPLVLISAPVTGMYRASCNATVTTAATTSSVLGGATGFQFGFKNANGDAVTKQTSPAAVTDMTSTLNTTAATVTKVFVGYAASGANISIGFGYTSVGGTPMAYDLVCYLEYLG